jgi:hypothetical protein
MLTSWWGSLRNEVCLKYNYFRMKAQSPRQPGAPTLSARERRVQQRVARALATVDLAVPGTILQRLGRCGKTACRCHADPPQLHGPYFQWTRKVAGKTVTRILSPQQVRRYQTWFDNDRKLRQLITELETLSIAILERDSKNS